MKKTGQLLKDKRESSNLSLGEVALATKINPKILSAIERGDEQSLPAKTILKGFIRAYALFLKMDVEEVLRTFQEESGGASPVVERVSDNISKSEGKGRREVHQESSSSAMRTAAVVVIILLIGLIIGIRELIEKYQREKVTTTEPTEIAKLDPVTAPALPGGEVAVGGTAVIGTTSPAAVAIVPTPATEVKTEDPKIAAEKAAAEKAAADKAAAEKIAADKKATEEKIAAEKKAAEEKKIADKKAAEEKKAEDKRLADEKKAADKKAAEEKKLAEEKALAEKKAEDKRLADEKKAAEKKAAEEKKAEDKRLADEKKAADKKAAEEKKLAEEKANADKKAAAEKKAADDKKAADEKAAADKPAADSPLKTLKNEIILEASSPVEVKFKIKGEEKRVSLNANEVHTIRADQPVTLDLSDGGAVSIIFNGRDRGVAGDAGKPKTIKIP